jgi:crotonobetainyl-CoA:carnitine CoA-transferase CaiB-like acyl-CoA transferase
MHVTGEPGRAADFGRPADLRSRHRNVGGSGHPRPSTNASAKGVGRLVGSSLLETAIGFSSWTSAQWLADHEEPIRQGSRIRQNAPYQRMRTKDGYDGRGRRSVDLGALCSSPGAPGMMRGPGLCDQRTADAEPRSTRSRDRRSTHHGNERSLGGGAGGSRRALRPGVQLRAAVRRPASAVPRPRSLCDEAELGKVPHIRTPIEIGDGVRVRTVAPKLGQHNAEIFRRLGVTEAEMQGLRTKHVL